MNTKLLKIIKIMTNKSNKCLKSGWRLFLLALKVFAANCSRHWAARRRERQSAGCRNFSKRLNNTAYEIAWPGCFKFLTVRPALWSCKRTMFANRRYRCTEMRGWTRIRGLIGLLVDCRSMNAANARDIRTHV